MNAVVLLSLCLFYKFVLLHKR